MTKAEVAKSTITDKVARPFPSYRWIWAQSLNREQFQAPETWLAILKALYESEGSHINPTNPASKTLIDNLSALDIGASLIQPDRTFLRGYQHYWTAVGALVPTSLTDSRVTLTPLGRAVASGSTSLDEFARIVIQRYELPNLASFANSPGEIQEWRKAGLNIKPLQFLLKLLLHLRSTAGIWESYLDQTELATLVIPLAANNNVEVIANEVLAFREGNINLELFPTDNFESHTYRNIKQFLDFLAIFGYCFVSKREVPIIVSKDTLERKLEKSDVYFLNTLGSGTRGRLEDSGTRLYEVTKLASAGQHFSSTAPAGSDQEIREFVGYLGESDVAIPPKTPSTAKAVEHHVVPTIDLYTTLAIASRPFLILCGPSGTGKTSTIVEAATRLDYGLLPEHERSRSLPANCLAFVPVGADWNDLRPLLGFKNPFGAERTNADGQKTNATYEITDALRLLLRASHPTYAHNPHFLILDEMNLSHVERYFSSFLSIVEADRSISSAGTFELISRDDLKLISEVFSDVLPVESDAANRLADLGRGLGIPPNVFIAGTVNVDETTYMFSPKVLDRAHVIELAARPPEVYFGTGLVSSERIEVAKAQLLFQGTIERRKLRQWERRGPAEIWNESALKVGFSNPLRDGIKEDVIKVLGGLYKLLDPVGFAFDKRPNIEVVTYLAVCAQAEKLSSENYPAGIPDEAIRERFRVFIDRAILQKILPKIHGSKRQLGGSLAAVSRFLNMESASYKIASGTEIAVSQSDLLGFKLPKCREKIDEMIATLEATHHTSFIR